jgi:hypothetical protein
MCAAASFAPIPAAAAATVPAGASAQAPTVLLAFAPAGGSALSRQLAESGFSLAILSGAEGSYSPAQLALDVSQGARISSAAYATPRPPRLSLAPARSGASIAGFGAARARAERAPQLLRPGLLAAQIPGGGAYAGPAGASGPHAAVAADLDGRVAAVSLGPPATLPARARRLLGAKRFVVCELPPGAAGSLDLLALARQRRPRELLIVVQDQPSAAGDELLWVGVAGLSGARGAADLSSQTTQQRGLVSSIDLAPTILAHLGVRRLAPDMRGAAIKPDGALELGDLRSLMARLRVIGPRRLRALGVLLCAWALLLLASLARGARATERRALALRLGALALLWAPAATLLTAALEPGAVAEYAIIAAASFLLAALTCAALPWPRAPLAPALVTLGALSADALGRWQLLMRSLLGPNPILGARFYGFGNELKSALAVMVLAAVAAATYPPRAPGRVRRRSRPAVLFAACCALLAALEGWARIGAAVGGLVLVCAAGAVASAVLLPGPITRRRALVALLSPVAGLVVLAALDLATAHGTGHYTGSILHARSAGDLRDVLVRRYSAAWRELRNHAMPAATAVALLGAAAALRWRERLLLPVGAHRVWSAALAGAVTAGVIGSLVEDSGPVLLVVAMFTLGCVLAYLWGRPPAGDVRRSRARRRGDAAMQPSSTPPAGARGGTAGAQAQARLSETA